MVQLACGSLVFALIAVTAWWFWGGLLDDWRFALYHPSFVITVLLSRNAHDINPVIGFIAQVVQTFLMMFFAAAVASSGWRFLRHRRQPRPDARDDRGS
jgi:hypothetical protein